jgi:c-di-GMP-binding flagellar brake protein YcgR
MAVSYQPVAGQVVMVEPLDEQLEERCLTGVVIAGEDARVTIDLGASARRLRDGADVIVSVFSADAMYKLHASMKPSGKGVVLLDPIYEVERVQRRRSPRRALRLGVTLVSTAESDPDVLRVAGRSLDVGAGGLRVETIRPLPKGAEPIAIVSIPHGAPLMLPTRVVTADEGEDGCEYRLAFTHLRPSDADRLAVLMDSTASAVP